MTKELYRLVYRSRARISDDDVAGRDAIFKISLKNNHRDEITGCLAQPDGHFVQVIEGAKNKLDALMDRIRSDERHQDLTVLGEWKINGRLFRGWAMARPDPAPMSEQSFRVCVNDGSGVEVTSVLLSLMTPGDHLYAVT